MVLLKYVFPTYILGKPGNQGISLIQSKQDNLNSQMKTDSHSRAPEISVAVLSVCRTKLNRI